MRGLLGHVQRQADADAGKGLLLLEALPHFEERAHGELRQLHVPHALVGQARVADLEVFALFHRPLLEAPRPLRPPRARNAALHSGCEAVNPRRRV